jgi:hypothetical protein
MMMIMMTFIICSIEYLISVPEEPSREMITSFVIDPVCTILNRPGFMKMKGGYRLLAKYGHIFLKRVILSTFDFLKLIEVRN